MEKIRLFIVGAVVIVAFIVMLIINPFSVNDSGSRTVVQRMGGEQLVQFAPGVFYSGFFSKEKEWPNQITVSSSAKEIDYDLVDNSVEIGLIGIKFNDYFTAKTKSTVQYVLPNSAEEMIIINNTHRSPESLVSKVLATYTISCMNSSAQLMSCEMHYGGGKAQMEQNFLDQLQQGAFLLNVQEKVVYDTIEKESKRIYEAQIQVDPKTNKAKRNASLILQLGITVTSAIIEDVDYDDKVDQRLSKVIDARTKLAVSKQNLMTAQQEILTSKAQGEKELVDIEYQQKKEQTKQVVAAETKVKLAEQDKIQQKTAYEGSIFEAMKIKTLADADAYAKAKAIQADGALKQKIDAYVEVQLAWAKAFGEYDGSITPTYVMGGSGASMNSMQTFMDLNNMNAMRSLSLNMNNK